MTTFWIFIALVVLISLMLIWIPHFRQQKMLSAEESGVRKQTNLELFNERAGILAKELEEGLLDQTEFDALKKELEIGLLQDMKIAGDDSLDTKLKAKGILWPSIMTVGVLAVSGYFYSTLGAYQELATPPQAEASPHQGMSNEQIMAQRVQMMEQQVQAEPENSQAWFSLGHAYISANQFDHAVASFDKVMELVGTASELLGPKATALYYKNGQQMNPQIQALVDQSLALDPNDPSTLLLVGMDAFFTADYQSAITAWQSILDSDRKDVDRTALMNAIESAQMRIQAETGVMPNDSTHNPMAAATAEAGVKTVDVAISIAPELADQVSSSDMVFIFARSTQGPKVPLAATKISANSLPVTVTLDDTTSMGGDVKLSSAANVEIIAVLSKHGSVKAQPGDLKGIVASVAVGKEAKLLLDTVVQ
ncbi:c-type cytochrome biogenesis protein CcmI [Shewanella sp. 10N.286.51.B2]|uniref:c-type cytochrome biogenesis protein CcmI n=1 Tax=unclassified Shewanella TaxID=196818 RepID=UPI000C82FEA0|nr:MULTISPECIES: c-type cytochrome biogenesis protein CcmI [unclassified Shewanella]MDO6642030.1 c-type cytochrome biogenesis protein CcmI [Shewanella sp. 5_MG-2023]PMH97166.1 c-type cytochrome biogenesis protein CcmI [Shewanella sp. 10N.286.48.A6]